MQALVPFTADAADRVSSWATTAEEVAAWCSGTDVPVPPAVVAGWGEQDDVRAYLLVDHGEPVAYGELWIDDDEHEVEIAHVLVDPRRRNEGMGRVLTARLAEVGRQVHPTVFLRFVPGNAAAEASYRGAGFERLPSDQEREWNGAQPCDYFWMVYRR
jgi:GNAT superfamily N-acetyltransferase